MILIINLLSQELSYYRSGLASLVKKSKYKGAMNARVVLQPGLEDLQLPRDEELALEVVITWIILIICIIIIIMITIIIVILQVTGLPKLALLPDMSYLAPDCFHPSQKLHAKSRFSPPSSQS